MLNRVGKIFAVAVIMAAVLLGLELPRAFSWMYLLSHSLVELFSIVIGFAIFTIAWNSRRRQVNNYLQFLGVAYLLAAGLDAMHMLTYEGMGTLGATSANLPTQLWTAARYVQAIALVAAPFFLSRRFSMEWALAAGLGLVGLLLASIYLHVFPDCFVKPEGLTWFKIISEAVICGLIAVAIVLLLVRREHFDQQVLYLVVGSLVVTIASELAFTLYHDPRGPWNWVGHCLKVAAFYLMYRAIVVTAMARPFDVLWRDLQEAKAAAESANRAKDRFLAMLSHELRNPLSPVLMAVSAIARQIGSSEPLRQDLEVIRRNVELEGRLIDDLLDLTRIARGKLKLEERDVDAHELLGHAMEICRGEAQEKRIEVAAKLAAQKRWVRGDPARLQQVFWNLIRNAVKFTPEGGRVTITTRDSSVRERAMEIEVADTGMGIEPQVLPRIFDAFEQGGQEVTRRYGGLGLGLAISKSLTEMHGGTIWAQSAGRDKGAKFTVMLPTIAAGARMNAPDAAPRSDQDAAGGERSLRILLVEDHPDTLRIMTRLLECFHYSIETAEGVGAALLAAGNRHFDLVISDVGLPDGSGLELMRQLKAHYGLKGICLSGHGMERDVRDSLAAGFAEHMTKPIDFQRLHEAIERVTAQGTGTGTPA